MNVVRVGLDGRALTNQNRLRGIGLYTARLLEALLKVTGDYEFMAFGYGAGPEAGLLEPGTAEQFDWWELPCHEKLPFHELLMDHILYAQAVKDSGVSLFHGIDHNLSPYIQCPSLVTVHDLIPLMMPGPYLGPRHLLWVKAHGRAARRARMVVTDSDHTRKDVERLYGIPRERIKVVYAGVDQEHRPVEDDRLIKESLDKYGIKRPFFLSTGGLDPRKNIGNALLGFQMFLIESGSDCQFVLCGDPGRFEGYVQDEIADLGLEGRVVLTGFVPNEDLPPLYSSALALVFISLYEGFGLPPLESMKYETPVLTSEVSSIPEVVGDAGLYVDPLDPADIASGMTRLASDEGLRRELVEKGLRRAPAFTWEKAACQILDLYPRVMGEAG